jgi:outer membrane protein
MSSLGSFNSYQTTMATLGIQVNWPVFTGGAIRGRMRETSALVDKAQAQLNDAVRTSTQATRAAYYTLQSTLEQVKALQAAQDASHAALQANQLGYKVGARTNIDVLNAESQLFEAQRNLARARYDALIGLLRLKQAAGTLVPTDLAQIDKLLVQIYQN